MKEFMGQRSKISGALQHAESWGEKKITMISHSLIFRVKWTAIFGGRIIVWTEDFIINPRGLADPGSDWGLIRYETHKALLTRRRWKEASNLDSELVRGAAKARSITSHFQFQLHNKHQPRLTVEIRAFDNAQERGETRQDDTTSPTKQPWDWPHVWLAVFIAFGFFFSLYLRVKRCTRPWLHLLKLVDNGNETFIHTYTPLHLYTYSHISCTHTV